MELGIEDKEAVRQKTQLIDLIRPTGEFDTAALHEFYEEVSRSQGTAFMIVHPFFHEKDVTISQQKGDHEVVDAYHKYLARLSNLFSKAHDKHIPVIILLEINGTFGERRYEDRETRDEFNEIEINRAKTLLIANLQKDPKFKDVRYFVIPTRKTNPAPLVSKDLINQSYRHPAEVIHKYHLDRIILPPKENNFLSTKEREEVVRDIATHVLLSRLKLNGLKKTLVAGSDFYGNVEQPPINQTLSHGASLLDQNNFFSKLPRPNELFPKTHILHSLSAIGCIPYLTNCLKAQDISVGLSQITFPASLPMKNNIQEVSHRGTTIFALRPKKG